MRCIVKDRGGNADGESGYVLLAVIFLTVVMLVSLAVAAPKIARSIQRDKDLETIHRGEQYKRALQLYYRQFGSYPTSIDQLVDTNNVRYLRKRYKDPETGKDDWKPVLYGQAHVRPLGFFGQPLSAVPFAEIRPSSSSTMKVCAWCFPPAPQSMHRALNTSRRRWCSSNNRRFLRTT